MFLLRWFLDCFLASTILPPICTNAFGCFCIKGAVVLWGSDYNHTRKNSRATTLQGRIRGSQLHACFGYSYPGPPNRIVIPFHAFFVFAALYTPKP